MTTTGALGAQGRTGQPSFREEQRFPLWIKATPLLTAAVLGAAVGGLWLVEPFPPGRVDVVVGIPLAVLLLLHVPLVALHFRTTLVVRVDSSGLHLRVHPLRWSLLPSRMTRKDIALADIVDWKLRRYSSLTGTEFWGWHFWGLSAARNGRYLYVMRPSGPVTARGVELRLGSGEKLIVGSQRPAEFLDVLRRLKATPT
jgi:hypothetical protein